MPRLKNSDRFDYRFLAKFGQLVILAFGVAAVVFSYRAEFPHLIVAWVPRAIGAAFCAACISYPSAVEIARDFLRIHYLFGASRTFAYEELDFEFGSTTLTVRVKGHFLKRVFGSFYFVLELPFFVGGVAAGTIELVPDGDQMLEKLASRTSVSWKDGLT